MIKIFSIQEIRAAAKKFCFGFCPMKEFGECVLNPETSGTICILEYYLEKLESGELRK